MGVLQGKAGEAAGERDKDHRWTRPGQGGKATGERGPLQVDPAGSAGP
jgi:hypothetical protein